ncbi:hypothetical protein F751_0947 [Auxenochlorella protothecoides]|uniref:Uncharacterized protein n=1 Tax=Auxenochlorella protothecoides TaxID=3075 RepID=A0A087SDC9_AUXPR|nr:hypothetical protein F751_0947 [Auxenochlorella protothecoides]KFM23733.1 hypothetical protein F751_0947 [Auxenochlorella protothecoides]
MGAGDRGSFVAMAETADRQGARVPAAAWNRACAVGCIVLRCKVNDFSNACAACACASSLAMEHVLLVCADAWARRPIFLDTGQAGHALAMRSRRVSRPSHSAVPPCFPDHWFLRHQSDTCNY